MARSGSIRLTAAHSISRQVTHFSQALVHGSQWLMYGPLMAHHVAHGGGAMTQTCSPMARGSPGMAHSGHSTYLEASAFIFLVLMLNLQRLIHDSQRLTHGSHGSLMVHIGSLMARSGSLMAQSGSRRLSQSHGGSPRSSFMAHSGSCMAHGGSLMAHRVAHGGGAMSQTCSLMAHGGPDMAHSDSPMAQICLFSILKVVHH